MRVIKTAGFWERGFITFGFINAKLRSTYVFLKVHFFVFICKIYRETAQIQDKKQLFLSRRKADFRIALQVWIFPEPTLSPNKIKFFNFYNVFVTEKRKYIFNGQK